MKKALICCGLAVTLISACSPANPPQATVGVQDANHGVTGTNAGFRLLGPGPINYAIGHEHREEMYYEFEQNHSTSFRSLTADRHDLGDDHRFIGSIVAREEGVTPGMVIIAGSHAWVNVRFDGQMNSEQRNKKMQELQKKIQQQVPRYQIHLNQNER